MKVRLEFVGMIKKIVGWKAAINLDIPEGSTVEFALKEVGIEWGKTKELGFTMIDKAKIKDKNHVLKPDDMMKVFPRSFGG